MPFVLLQNEKLNRSYQAYYRRSISGILYVTNYRICWMSDDDLRDINISFQEIDFEEDVEYQNVPEQNKSVIGIMQNGRRIIFHFTAPNHFNIVKQLYNDINSSFSAFNTLPIGYEEQCKLNLLSKTPHLYKLYTSLVHSNTI